MKIDEAIEIKEAYLRGDEPDDPLDLIKADRLGIEALKLIAQEPPEGYTCIPRPLPGETEE